jgi:acetyltransferase-like isoleucine patch superfamily enzyme
VFRQILELRSFLRGKIGHLSAGELLFSQYEAWWLWLVGGLPGVVGCAVRTAVGKLLFKELRGFAWIQPGVTFVQTNRIRVGSHFGINTGSYINGIGGITMGNHVLIGSNVTISSGQHSIDGTMPPVFARPSLPKAITIEDDVWIGAGAVIMPGVTLRRGTVVGANSVVTRDTDEYAVVVGAPARKVRTRA